MNKNCCVSLFMRAAAAQRLRQPAPPHSADLWREWRVAGCAAGRPVGPRHICPQQPRQVHCLQAPCTMCFPASSGFLSTMRVRPGRKGLAAFLGARARAQHATMHMCCAQLTALQLRRLWWAARTQTLRMRRKWAGCHVPFPMGHALDSGPGQPPPAALLTEGKHARLPSRIRTRLHCLLARRVCLLLLAAPRLFPGMLQSPFKPRPTLCMVPTLLIAYHLEPSYIDAAPCAAYPTLLA